jgi:hypothetical protein
MTGHNSLIKNISFFQEKVRSVRDLAGHCQHAPLLVITDGEIPASERDSLTDAGKGRLRLVSIEDVETLEATKLVDYRIGSSAGKENDEFDSKML